MTPRKKPGPTTLDVERIAIAELVPDESNAREHLQGIPELAESLKQFGQMKPAVVFGDNVVIAGNGLLEAASSLNWTHIFIVRTPKDWDIDKARAFALADNRTAELSAWKTHVLDAQLFSLTTAGWDMPKFGFSITPPPGLFLGDPDDVPDVPKVAKSRLGDIYTLGDHRLICGDATDPDTYRRLMNAEKADCIWTDPPYGVEYIGKTKDKLTIQNDGSDGIASLLSRSFACWSENAIEGAAIYIAHPPAALALTFMQEFLKAGWRLHETLVWDKQTIVLGHSDYHYSHEPILFGYTLGGGRRGRGGDGWYGDDSQRSVISIPKPSRSQQHPTMKPVELVTKCITNSAPVDGIVMDPFGGSGSTLIACEQKHRRGRMVELDPLYVDVIVQRWEDLTGKKAVLNRRRAKA